MYLSIPESVDLKISNLLKINYFINNNNNTTKPINHETSIYSLCAIRTDIAAILFLFKQKQSFLSGVSFPIKPRLADPQKMRREEERMKLSTSSPPLYKGTNAMTRNKARRRPFATRN